jgi:hypothetical protein
MTHIRRTLLAAACALALVASSLVFASGAKALTAGSTTTCVFTPSTDLFALAPGGMTLCTTETLTFSHTDTLCLDGQVYTQDVYILVVDQRVYAGNQVGPGASLRPHAKLLYTFDHGAFFASDDPVPTGESC